MYDESVINPFQREHLTDSENPEDYARADGFMVPHVMTFQSLLGFAWRTYWNNRFDEAIRRAREEARAMRRDGFLMSLLFERYRSTLTLDWHLEVEDERDPRQKQMKEHLTRVVRRTIHLPRIMWNLLEAIWFGRHAVQLQYQETQIEGIPSLQAVGFLPHNGDKIGHLWDHTPHLHIYPVLADRLPPDAHIIYTPGGDGGARSLVLRGRWRQPFIIHRHVCIDEDYWESEAAEAVHGVGLRHWLYWWNWLKNEWITNLSRWAERAGRGIRVWPYQAGNADDKARAEAASKENLGRINLVVPVYESMTYKPFEFIDQSGQGQDMLIEIIQHAEKIQERLVIGQTLSSSTEGSGLGGTGVSRMHADTKTQIIRQDAETLEITLTCDWLNVLKRYSFPDMADIPVYWRFDVDTPDAAEQMEAISKAYEMGVDFVKHKVRELTGQPDPHEDDDTISKYTDMQQTMALEQQAAIGQQMQPQQGQGGGEEMPDPDEADFIGNSDAEDLYGRPFEPKAAGQYSQGTLWRYQKEPTEREEPTEAPAPSRSHAERWHSSMNPTEHRHKDIAHPHVPGQIYEPTHKAYGTSHFDPEKHHFNDWHPYTSNKGKPIWVNPHSGHIEEGRKKPNVHAAIHARPQVSHAKYDSPQDERLYEHLHRAMEMQSPDELQKLIGAQPGSNVRVRPRATLGDRTAASWEFSNKHPRYKSQRRALRFGPDNELVMDNTSYKMHPEHQAGGHALRVFSDQALHAANHGVDRIETYGSGFGIAGLAAQSGRGLALPEGLELDQGYHVWPKMGFEGKEHPFAAMASRPKEGIPEHLRNAKSLTDLYTQPGGAEFWKQYGTGMDMSFDLTPGSQSWQTLNAYRQSKGLTPIVVDEKKRARIQKNLQDFHQGEPLAPDFMQKAKALGEDKQQFLSALGKAHPSPSEYPVLENVNLKQAQSKSGVSDWDTHGMAGVHSVNDFLYNEQLQNDTQGAYALGLSMNPNVDRKSPLDRVLDAMTGAYNLTRWHEAYRDANEHYKSTEGKPISMANPVEATNKLMTFLANQDKPTIMFAPNNAYDVGEWTKAEMQWLRDNPGNRYNFHYVFGLYDLINPALAPGGDLSSFAETQDVLKKPFEHENIPPPAQPNERWQQLGLDESQRAASTHPSQTHQWREIWTGRAKQSLPSDDPHGHAGAMEELSQRFSPTVHNLLSKGAENFHYHDSFDEVASATYTKEAEALDAQGRDAEATVMRRRLTAIQAGLRSTPIASFSHRLGHVHWDGPETEENLKDRKQFRTPKENIQHIQAHELGHAVDRNHVFSTTDAWNQAWQADIQTQQGTQKLTTYASSSPHEGFAEFFRLLHASELTTEDVDRRFPSASAFFQYHHLWPGASAGGTQPRPEPAQTKSIAPEAMLPATHPNSVKQGHLKGGIYSVLGNTKGDEKILDPHRKTVERMDRTDREIIADYTNQGYMSLNDVLRHDEKLDDVYAAKQSSLTNALSKAEPLAGPVMTWRGIGRHSPQDVDAMFAWIENARQKGWAVQLPGFSSTSLNAMEAFKGFGNVKAPVQYGFEILSTKGVYVDDYLDKGKITDGLSANPGEYEFLLDHNSVFRIRGIREDTKGTAMGEPARFIQLEQVPDVHLQEGRLKYRDVFNPYMRGVEEQQPT